MTTTFTVLICFFHSYFQEMGGKGEQGEQKLRATQDQLRIARLTQDANFLEDDRVNIQKLIKKVPLVH